MMRNSALRRTFALIFALAVAALESSSLSAQQFARVRHRDLAATGAPTLYDAIAQILPEWLPQGEANRVAVFVNGTYQGDASRLRTILTDSVASVRRIPPEDVRRLANRYPAGDFDAALFVSMRGTGARARHRFTVSLDGGMGVAAMPSAGRRSLVSAGYDKRFHSYTVFIPFLGTYEDRTDEFSEEGTNNPVAFGATFNYRVGQVWGVAVSGQHTTGGWIGGYSAEADSAVSATASSTEGAILLTADVNAVRVGVGPAFQRTNWEWVGGWCQCEDPQSSTTTSLGAAAEVVVPLPLVGGPVVPAVRMLGRYYAPAETAYGVGGPAMEVGGFMFTMGVSLATRF
ncbi:MAG TPA: hypothetical protein VEQ60_09390 [Longimicrobium sp.]|nr:hypothetical protein [Longimicrobium sp.]